jgi:hypothetical protein
MRTVHKEGCTIGTNFEGSSRGRTKKFVGLFILEKFLKSKTIK